MKLSGLTRQLPLTALFLLLDVSSFWPNSVNVDLFEMLGLAYG